jgi:hypothetical protein
MEFSVANDLPFIMLDDPDPFSSLESLEQHLAELASDARLHVQAAGRRHAPRIIGIRKTVEAGAKHPNGE